jgi:hypothetical protein
LEDGDVEQRQDNREETGQEVDGTIVGRVVQGDDIENSIRKTGQRESKEEKCYPAIMF